MRQSRSRGRRLAAAAAVAVVVVAAIVAVTGTSSTHTSVPRDGQMSAGASPFAARASEGEVRWRATLLGRPVGLLRDHDGVIVTSSIDGVTGATSEIRSLSPVTGELRWRTALSAPAVVAPAGDSDTVVVATSDGVSALNRASGKLRWEQAFLGVGAIAIGDASGGQPFVVSSGVDGTVVARDRDSGQERWALALPGEQLRPPDLVVGGGSVVVTVRTTETSALYALDAATGATRWSTALRRGVAIPVIVHDTVVVADGDERGGRVQALALERGEPRWSTAVPAPFEPGVVPGFDDDGVAVVDVLGNVSLLDAASGRLHWTTATSFAPVLESAVLVTGSAVAFTVGATRLVLLDRALGGVRAVRTETGVLHGLAAADGTLLELMSARAASPSGAASAPPSWVEARPFP